MKGSPRGHSRNVGKLHKRYRFVPAGVRRVLYRPYVSPKRLYFICSAGVFLCNPDSYDKKALLKRGYAVNTALTHKNQVVLERTVSHASR